MSSSPIVGRSSPVIVIAGATGLVGAELVSVLGEQRLPYSELRLLASPDSAGEIYRIGSDEVVVEELRDGSFEGADIVVFATSSDLAERFIPRAEAAGASVIDVSGYSVVRAPAPLMAPGITPCTARWSGRVALPGAPAVMIAPTLAAMRDLAGIRKVVITTLESVSGAGRDALDELWSQTLAIFNQKEVVNEVFEHQIAFNCIPTIGVLTDQGETSAELRLARELRELLGLPTLEITVTSIRVPVFHGQGASVFVETERPLDRAAFLDRLRAEPIFALYDAPEELPTHLGSVGTDSVHVGRVRIDGAIRNRVTFWTAADNIRRGAALPIAAILDGWIGDGAGRRSM